VTVPRACDFNLLPKVARACSYRIKARATVVLTLIAICRTFSEIDASNASSLLTAPGITKVANFFQNCSGISVRSGLLLSDDRLLPELRTARRSGRYSRKSEHL